MAVSQTCAIAISKWQTKRDELKALAIRLTQRDDLGGYNLKFANENVLVKVCRHDGRVPDICEREQFTTLMGTLLAVPVVDSAVIPIVDGMGVPTQLSADYVQNRCVAMPFLSNRSLDRRPVEFQDFNELANIFCFMH